MKSKPGRSGFAGLVARLAVLVAMLPIAATAAIDPVTPDSVAADAVEVWVTTTDRHHQLSREPDIRFGKGRGGDVRIDVDERKRYQEMVGFGAAMTDASAWLIQTRMSSEQRAALLQELFGRPQGLGLSFMRLTIGASDFSRTHYSLDDRPRGEADPNLAHFSIDSERADVIPVVKAALAINPQLKVMASPWSAPAWMKTSDSLIRGHLRPEFYGPFALYLSHYVDAMTAEGVPIFAISVQNEPHFEPADYPGMRVDSADRAKLIGEFVGPLFARRHPSTRIVEWDHNWNEPNAPLKVLADPSARRYIAGVGWHCYEGDVAAQGRVHRAYPEKETYFTECSGGEWQPLKSDGLTWLTRQLIIGATRQWAKGVLLWNFALDPDYGPHLGGCPDCHGVVTIDPKTGEVTRNFEYYVLAHASKFVRPGARRIFSSSGEDGIDSVAFLNEDDGTVALIVSNSDAAERRIGVRVGTESFTYAMPASSVATFVWRSVR